MRKTLPAVALLAVACAGCASATAHPPSGSPRPHPRPNIVYVLTDDLSWDLVRWMPQVRRMQREGLTFRQFVVADSLCCSSRATILTGSFPHNTHVLGNVRPSGGYSAFWRFGAQRRSVAIALQHAGYRTALMGKYLNGYKANRHGPDPGWDEWLGSSSAYTGFGYRMSDNGRLVIAGYRPRDYVTDVLARHAARFIRQSAGRRPFFITISTYAPHRPYTPAPRHRGLFRHVPLPEGPSFDARVSRPPSWLGRRPPLSAAQRRGLLHQYRQRVRSVQAVDELIGRVRAVLRARGVAGRTYIVFGSDNGYHMGQHRLTPGKRTAFDHDVRVPLIVVGPDVRRGASTSALTGTVDLAPTFEAWAGAPVDRRRDGRSLTPLLDGRPPRWWRRALLIEHTAPGVVAGDPDIQGWTGGKPPSYRALRTARATYVEYANGDRELYDRRTDPGELVNRANRLTALQRIRLSAALARYRRCRGARACWAAGRSELMAGPRAGRRWPGSPRPSAAATAPRKAAGRRSGG